MCKIVFLIKCTADASCPERSIASFFFADLAVRDDVGNREIAARLKTRWISEKAFFLSGTRLMTQLLITRSTVPLSTGRDSISPRRNSTFAASTFDLFSFAFSNHLFGHIDSDDFSACADMLRRNEAIDAGS